MTSFAIGRIVEPVEREITVKGKKRKVYSLGLLVGRTCTNFDIFDDSKIYDRLSRFEDGDQVLAVVGVTVGDNGKLRNYLNAIGLCPEGLGDQLRDLVNGDA